MFFNWIIRTFWDPLIKTKSIEKVYVYIFTLTSCSEQVGAGSYSTRFIYLILESSLGKSKHLWSGQRGIVWQPSIAMNYFTAVKMKVKGLDWTSSNRSRDQKKYTRDSRNEKWKEISRDHAGLTGDRQNERWGKVLLNMEIFWECFHV